MLTRTASYAEAIDAFRTNPASRWFLDGEAPADQRAGTAQFRLCQDWFRPVLRAKARLPPQPRCFVIGNAFARSIERILAERQIECLSACRNPLERWLPADPDATHQAAAGTGSYLNKFNAPAIAAEFRWAVDPPPIGAHPAVAEIRPGHWVDLAAHNILAGAAEADVRDRRAVVNAVTARAFDADLIVLVLDSIECWFDRATGLYLNDPAPDLGIDDAAERIELHALGLADNLRFLTEIHDSLVARSSRDFRILVMVSPVPVRPGLAGTDFVSADTYTKSMVRAVAEEFARLPRVEYFPALEIAVNSPSQTAWEPGRRAVSAELSRHMVDLLLETHAMPAEPAAAAGSTPA